MRVAAFSLLALLLATVDARLGTDDFSFIHCSDTHSPVAGSDETIAAMRAQEGPSFVIVTGDLTEFGGPSAGKAGWDRYLGYWKEFRIPVYHALGNHDNTWDCARPALRRIHGAPWYSFEKQGCRFVALDSATPQDPRPSFGHEMLAWLREDLRAVKKDVPLFLFFHHPPQGNEWASSYDAARLFDLVRPYHVAAFLVGHHHTSWHRRIEGFDVVGGGSTFGPNPGWNVVSIGGGVMRVVYRRKDGTQTGVLEKKLERASVPSVVVTSPLEDDEIGASVTVTAEVRDGPKPKSMAADVDGSDPVAMTERKDGSWAATLSKRDGVPGRHVVRAVADFGGGLTMSRHVPVRVARENGPEERWRVQLGGAVRSMRAHGDRVFAGDGAGTMHALRLADGAPLWTFATGGEILSRPAVAGELVVFGSGDGHVYALEAATGKERWKFAAEAASYASPAVAGGRVVVATNAGRVVALDASTGAVQWTNTSAEYSVESAVHVSGGSVFAGAWDQHVHAMALADGKALWKCQGAGAAVEKAKKYYSPADCGPVACGGRVYAADRKYMLSVIDARSGERTGQQDDVVATGLAADGASVYLRRTKDALVKLGADGAELWSAKVDTDAVPAAPVEEKGVVYVSSGRGLVSAVDAATGKVLWRYQATPRLWVMGPLEAKEALVLVGCQDGTITALRGP